MKTQHKPPRGLFPAAPEYASLEPDTMFAATEYRIPVKGDWYLSGAIVEAYLSPATLSYPFWIARKAGHMVTCPRCKGKGRIGERT